MKLCARRNDEGNKESSPREMSCIIRVLLAIVLLLVTAHRLPAPISEIPESPTPSPEQSAKPKPKRTIRPRVTTENPESSTGSTAPSTQKEHAGTPKIEVTLAKDEDSKPAKVFPADIPKVYAFFKTKGTQKGDKVRGVWIAEDVGNAAPKETKIDEATMTADGDTSDGNFSLTKPTKGWPVGKYRIEIYVGGRFVETVKFQIVK
jgi:hypothetical protein